MLTVPRFEHRQVFEAFKHVTALPREQRPVYPSALVLTVSKGPPPRVHVKPLTDQVTERFTRPPLEERLQRERGLDTRVARGEPLMPQATHEKLFQAVGRVPLQELLGYQVTQNGGANALEVVAAASSAATQDRYLRDKEAGCRVPNTLLSTVRAGTSGCTVLRFSNSGAYLAAVVVDGSRFHLKVMTHLGRDVAAFSGHSNWVYDVSWSSDDSQIVTASSDFSARLWSLRSAVVDYQGGSGAVNRPTQLFKHGGFVYAAAFHPTADSPHLVATAAFDGGIRIWVRLE